MNLQVSLAYFIKLKSSTSQPWLNLSFFLIETIKVIEAEGVYGCVGPKS